MVRWFWKKAKQAYRERRWGSFIRYIVLAIIVLLVSFLGLDRLAEWSNRELDERSADMIPFFLRVFAWDLFPVVAWLIILGFAVIGFVILYKRAGGGYYVQEKDSGDTKPVDSQYWVTCDKCGFIGVRNIKTREFEEMEDNQRRTGQPILTRINSLGDTEPRHEKIPECIMQAEDFATLPPLSSQPLPLFYMQFPRQCQHFIEWQKGLTPKEHKVIIDRQQSKTSTSHTILIPKTKLSNRDTLFRAIYEFQDVANQLIPIQEEINKKNEQGNYTNYYETIAKRDEAYDRFKQAQKELNAERLVAGQPYKKVISDLVSFAWVQVAIKRRELTSVGNKQIELDFLQFVGILEGMVEKATQEIDRISSQALDKEDSQP